MFFIINSAGVDKDPFDILPPGWVEISHFCGMPVYLHKEMRVCTLSRPYSLGNASGRVMTMLLLLLLFYGVFFSRTLFDDLTTRRSLWIFGQTSTYN